MTAALAAATLLFTVPMTLASAKTTAVNPTGYTISITSMTPSYAKADSTIKVSGTLTNRSGSSVSGLAVQLSVTPSGFSTSSQMEEFGSDPGSFFVSSPVGDGFQVAGTVANGGTVNWSASFTAADAGFSSFGVYGVQAAVTSSAGTPVAYEGTYLPYWPSSGASARMKIAWAWPLIDTPHQTPCGGTLTDDSLGSSLSATGRLGTLLSVGESYASTAHLTWAVDPALLSEAQTMTGTYYTGGQSDCSQTDQHPASGAAKQWLAKLSGGTASDPMFVTPYADVDVSALSHAGLDSDLRTAYSLGNSVAGGLLDGRTFESIGWPADGIADMSVLQSMAEYGHIGTVLLDSSQMPVTSGYDDAVANITTGVGDTLRVLLSNDTITGILSNASTRSAGESFNVEQDYLAQTAMIAAEAPSLQRSIVVAPPSRWDPSSTVASQLLSDTVNTPWLEPEALSDVAAGGPAAAESHAQPSDRVIPSNELSTDYLNKVQQASSSVDLFQSLLASPVASYLQRLEAVLVGTESSAWRGNTSGGENLLDRLTSYISDAENKIALSEVKRATLAGKSGTLPVSVYNGMDQAIEVRVVASVVGARVTIKGDIAPVTVQPRQVETVHLSLNSLQIGTTQVKLQLVTKDNSPLPISAQSVSVVSTLYGRTVLVLIIVALAIVVLTSATRWLRQWLANGPPASGDGTGSYED